MLDRFSEIKVETPVDKIIRQIRSLITTGELEPGDKLPPERKLSEKFGVGRSVVREAIRKLDFYGIVKTLPQSGTVIEGMGIVALEGLITDVLNIEETDFQSLVETRLLLEIESAGKAAERRTADDIIILENALQSIQSTLTEHREILDQIIAQNPKGAQQAMKKHLQDILDFSKVN